MNTKEDKDEIIKSILSNLTNRKKLLEISDKDVKDLIKTTESLIKAYENLREELILR